MHMPPPLIRAGTGARFCRLDDSGVRSEYCAAHRLRCRVRQLLKGKIAARDVADGGEVLDHIGFARRWRVAVQQPGEKSVENSCIHQLDLFLRRYECRPLGEDWN